jgi:hypothetical protein
MKRTKKAESKAFRPGFRGVCEAQLWRFSESKTRTTPTKEPEMELVAALSFDQALKDMRYRHRDFLYVAKNSIRIA